MFVTTAHAPSEHGRNSPVPRIFICSSLRRLNDWSSATRLEGASELLLQLRIGCDQSPSFRQNMSRIKEGYCLTFVALIHLHFFLLKIGEIV